MRLCSTLSRVSVALALLIPAVSADRVFASSSLDVCQTNSSFTSSLFNIVFTPDNKTLSINVNGNSDVTGNVTFEVHASVYGYTFLRETLDPCTLGLSTLCPLSQIETSFDATYTNISSSFISRIPGIAYQIPDLDAIVTVYLYDKTAPTVSLACVRLRISNLKTVNQVGVRWATGIIALIGFASSALVSALGYTNTAAHMMLYALSLFSYFQAVAIIGLCGVPLPPIVQAWAQDMSWSLGIIKVHFLQKFATWYQLATGGHPSTILTTLGTKSVQVAKRSIEAAHSLSQRSATIASTASGEYIVTGIDRVAYLENMEPTNLFFTSLTFYCIFVIFSLLVVGIFKAVCELAIRQNRITSNSHLYHIVRNDWRATLKGVIFRVILIGYLPMALLSLWEFTQNDSPAEIFLAVIFFFGMTAALGFAAFKVFQIAKRSQQLHHTPAYLFYADAVVLNKWGFLYTQFRASSYFYLAPTLGYILVKAAFVGLGQKSGVTQAIALIIIEAAALIGASVLKPWMDKTTNGINISICVINFLNAIFLLIFTNVFNGPGLLIGVVGVIFFIMNVVFALVLLLVVLFAVALSFIRKDPETHYQPVADNRASFIKSQTALSTELASLGVTARGEDHLDKEYGNFNNPDMTRHHQNNSYSNANHRDSSSIPGTPQSPAYMSPAHQAIENEKLGHGYQGSEGTLARLNAEGQGGGGFVNQGALRVESPSISSRSQSQNSNRPAGNSPWQRGAGYS
ncbi:related to Calcium_related spray protein [Phialocephala subalpina]|uniref:Related to Calcium_related spray protein n=1 Tax=Phialocephala subalpina TaxID=576137 RepID=A0A1L7X9D2_9HELO|nr:related to Calcium_related spray protein [Phialocephala subalpina]